MAETTSNPTAAIEAICRAFSGVERNGGISLHEAQVVDGWGTDPERAAARGKDTELRWEDIPAERIESAHNVLPYLDAEGFRYYIPAFMRWTLENMGRSSSLTIDSTICALTPYATQPEVKYALLTGSQAGAIAQFLAILVEELHDAMALEAFDYWSTRARADS